MIKFIQSAITYSKNNYFASCVFKIIKPERSSGGVRRALVRSGCQHINKARTHTYHELL